MRKILLLAVVPVIALFAALPPKPAEALPSNCGCYCVSYPTLQCKYGTVWIKCSSYAAQFCN